MAKLGPASAQCIIALFLFLFELFVHFPAFCCRQVESFVPPGFSKTAVIITHSFKKYFKKTISFVVKRETPFLVCKSKIIKMCNTRGVPYFAYCLFTEGVPIIFSEISWLCSYSLFGLCEPLQKRLNYWYVAEWQFSITSKILNFTPKWAIATQTSRFYCCQSCKLADAYPAKEFVS